MKPCDHVFRDSQTCLKCSVHVLVLGLELRFEALMLALGATYEQGRVVLPVQSGTLEAEVGRMHQDLRDFNLLRMEEHRLIARLLLEVRDVLARQLARRAAVQVVNPTAEAERLERTFRGCEQMIEQLGKGPRLLWPEAMP